jgi:hypothetical protein
MSSREPAEKMPVVEVEVELLMLPMGPMRAEVAAPRPAILD